LNILTFLVCGAYITYFYYNLIGIFLITNYDIDLDI